MEQFQKAIVLNNINRAVLLAMANMHSGWFTFLCLADAINSPRHGMKFAYFLGSDMQISS